MRYRIALAFFLLSIPCCAETIYFPQVVNGGGYQTTITIVNPGQVTVTGTLLFFTPGGQDWQLSINSAINSRFPVSVPASGSARFVTSGTGSIAVGWAALESAGVLSAVANYEVRTGGTLTETVGVIGSPAVKRFIVAADYDSHADVGLALVNAGATPLTVNLSLLDQAGNVIQASPDEQYKNIPAHGYVTKYASQAFPGIPSVHKGALIGEVDGGERIAVVSFILKDGMQSAAIPVSDPSIAITKRLLGEWALDYNWNGELWHDVFLLRWIEEGPTDPGQFSLWGYDDWGDLVSAIWDPERDYVLTRSVPDYDYKDIYVFSFTGENAISGCYYFEDLLEGSVSDCYPVTGVRTVQ